MNATDARAFRRTAVFLLAVSALRWGWQAGRPGVDGAALASADTAAALRSSSEALADEAARRSEPLGPGERVDPNRADEAELDRLPGVGAATARALVASREAEGPFRRTEDLARVRGIGPATVARIRPFLDLDRPPSGATSVVRSRSRPPETSGGAGPVDVNAAAPAELETLPGIGPALAARIVAERRDEPFRSVDDLLRVPGIGPATLERLRSRVRVGRR